MVDVAQPGEPREQRRGGGYPTKAAATEAMNALQAAKKDGSFIEPTRQTVAAYLTTWLAGVQGIRPSTLARYRFALTRQVIPRIGDVPLQKLTRLRVKALYRELAEAGGVRAGRALRPMSVHNCHIALRRAVRDAVDDGVLRVNPADRAHRKPQDRLELATWSGVELRCFLEAVDADPFLPLWRLAASTGMRRGEILGLRWSDVDLDGARLSVRQQLVRQGPKLGFGPPKTKAGRRSISLDPGTVAVLRSRRAVWADDKLRLGKGFADHDLVFCRADGSPWDPDVITRCFDRAVTKVGVPRIRFHDLRHTAASLLLAAGVHPKVVQERLGHSSIVITLDTYSHVIPNLQDEAAARIGALVDA